MKFETLHNAEERTTKSSETIENISLIPDLTETEIDAGIEYSHIMIKPEGMSADPKLAEEIVTLLLTMCEESELSTIAMFSTNITRQELNQIYKKELTAGIIPDWEIDRFCQEPTGHIIVKGPHATEVTFRIKGRFTCHGEEGCPYKNNTESKSAPCYDPPGFTIDHHQYPIAWGSGCGIRGMLARRDIVEPDSGETDYTVFNWLHTPDPGQTVAVNQIIELYNHHQDLIHPLTFSPRSTK